MIRRLIRKLGVDVVRYPHRHLKTEVSIVNVLKANRFKLIKTYDIDLVIDVGANEGQFGEELRSFGYTGKIVSFEPLKDAFGKLVSKAGKDEDWDAYNLALGDVSAVSEINIAGNSQSSSILPMGEVHQQSAPESIYVGTQKVEIKRLDELFPKYAHFKNIYLKLDVQGFEKKVFEGAATSLKKIKAVQLEMSLVELYTGESTFFEHSEFLISQGFRLMGLEPGFSDATTGQLLQVDGIWYR